MEIGTLLRSKELSSLKVISHHADLTREVLTIESTETPDVALYLPKHTLLLTTAMAYRENPAGLCALIEQLDALPCAGLAIKLGRFLDTLPEAVVDTADRLGFPLLQIPISVTLGDMYHNALAYLWNDKNQELTYALNTQKKFSNLMLQGAPLKALLNTLGYTLQCAVAIVTPFGEVCESNYTCSQLNFNVARRVFQELELYRHWNWERKDYIDDQNRNQQIAVFPIKVVGRNTNYLFLFGAEQLGSAMSALVVEQVRTVFGLCLYKNLYMLYNAIKQKESLLKLLLQTSRESSWSDHQILSIGAPFQLKRSSCYQVAVGALFSGGQYHFDSGSFGFREEGYILLFQWMEQRLTELCGDGLLVFPDSEQFHFVFLVQSAGLDLEPILTELYDVVARIFQFEMVFALGNLRYSLRELQDSYTEAVEALMDGEVREHARHIHYFRPRNLVELLKTVLSDQARGFCLHMLKALAKPEDDMLLELRRTLHTYLDNKCNVTETANKLFLHRNTVKYRIHKCEELLGHQFDDPDYCLQLQLSLMLAEEWDKQEEPK